MSVDLTQPRKAGRPSSREQKLREKLEKRKPMERTQALGAEVPEGFVARWFNDENGRIEAAVAAGWEFVMPSDKPGSVQLVNPETKEEFEKRKSKRVGRTKDGAALYAYLMVIEEEIFAADQQAKQKQNDEIMSAIERSAQSDEGEAPEGVKLKTADFQVQRG